MADPEKADKVEPAAEVEQLAAKRAAAEDSVPERIFLVPYPKIVFLYPTFLMALIAGTCLSFVEAPFDQANRFVAVLSLLFQFVLAVNLVILAFDFPRTTSLTLFFFVVALGMGAVLLFKFQPDLLPAITAFLDRFRPLANAAFYWGVVCILGAIYLVVLFSVRFDYWEVRSNELLHHHGFLANVERFPSPHLRIDKEISDVFEFLLLRSGRLDSAAQRGAADDRPGQCAVHRQEGTRDHADAQLAAGQGPQRERTIGQPMTARAGLRRRRIDAITARRMATGWSDGRARLAGSAD